jgi:hypothetical protein
MYLWSQTRNNVHSLHAHDAKIFQQLRADLLWSTTWQSESFYTSTTEPSNLADLTTVSIYSDAGYMTRVIPFLHSRQNPH